MERRLLPRARGQWRRPSVSSPWLRTQVTSQRVQVEAHLPPRRLGSQDLCPTPWWMCRRYTPSSIVPEQCCLNLFFINLNLPSSKDDVIAQVMESGYVRITWKAHLPPLPVGRTVSPARRGYRGDPVTPPSSGRALCSLRRRPGGDDSLRTTLSTTNITRIPNGFL